MLADITPFDVRCCSHDSTLLTQIKSILTTDRQGFLTPSPYSPDSPFLLPLLCLNPSTLSSLLMWDVVHMTTHCSHKSKVPSLQTDILTGLHYIPLCTCLRTGRTPIFLVQPVKVWTLILRLKQSLCSVYTAMYWIYTSHRSRLL